VRTQLDDLVLSWQHAVDRAMRRFRRGPRPEPGQPAFGNIRTRGGKDREEMSASRA
jgi:hypothetical protein